MAKKLSPLRQHDRRWGASEERDRVVRYLTNLRVGNDTDQVLQTIANWIRAGMHEQS